jgi:hypothetical protein
LLRGGKLVETLGQRTCLIDDFDIADSHEQVFASRSRAQVQSNRLDARYGDSAG